MKRFWEVEEVPDMRVLSRKNALCEKLFVETHSRNAEDRYIIELPFKNPEPHFGRDDVYATTLRRFLSLEKRLQNNALLYEKYCSTLREYLGLGYIETVLSAGKSSDCYLIPHHYITKPGKFRIVFDASAKSGGVSLNDTLLVDPKLQKDIVAFTCEIKGIFSQILVTEKHRGYQRDFRRRIHCRSIE